MIIFIQQQEIAGGGGPGTIALLLYLDPAWSLLKPPGDVLDPIVWIYKQFARDCCGGRGIGTVTLRHAPQLSKSALVNDNVEYNARIRKENQKYFSSFCWSLVELYFVF